MRIQRKNPNNRERHDIHFKPELDEGNRELRWFRRRHLDHARQERRDNAHYDPANDDVSRKHLFMSHVTNGSESISGPRSR